MHTMPKGEHRPCEALLLTAPHIPCFRLISSARSSAGPFASAAGVGRAEPEWAALNKVTDVCGVDRQHAAGVTTDAPIELPQVRRIGVGNTRSHH